MSVRTKPQLALPLPLRVVPKTAATRAPRATASPAAPVGSLMDSRFVYVPANKTDIAKTFARIRRAQQKGAIL